jgi:hypothetical protein
MLKAWSGNLWTWEDVDYIKLAILVGNVDKGVVQYERGRGAWVYSPLFFAEDQNTLER